LRKEVENNEKQIKQKKGDNFYFEKLAELQKLEHEEIEKGKFVPI
jgi:hypothetical protein